MSIMGTFLLLAAEAGAETAEVVEESSFGLNTNILDTNLINLLIIIFVLVYFGRNFLGSILAERRSQIETNIREAEQHKQEAAATLAERQQKLARVQTEADRIRSEGKQRAQSAKDAILAEAEEAIQRLRETAEQERSSEQDRIIAELRQRVIALAVEKVEAQLKRELTESAQQRLIDRSIALLGGRS